MVVADEQNLAHERELEVQGAMAARSPLSMDVAAVELRQTQFMLDVLSLAARRIPDPTFGEAWEALSQADKERLIAKHGLAA